MLRTASIARRPLTAPLSAAVLVAGLAVTGAAGAQAGGVRQDLARFTTVPGDPTVLVVDTEHDVDADEIRMTVAPFTVTSAADKPIDGERGLETDVEFPYDSELERGVVDVVGARRVLADEGVDHVVLTLYVDGRETGSAVYGPDADLGDDVPGELVGAYGPQDYDFAYRPDADERTLLSAPGSRMVYLQGGPSSGTPGGGVTVLAEEPQHGRLVVVPGVEGAQDQTGFDAWVYIADEGFTGRDEATFEIRRDGEKKTLAVTYSIGDERADDVPLGVEHGALPYAEARVLAQLGAGEDPAAAEDPAPTAPDAEHAVPGKVQTGDEAAWWAVGLGALGAGALVAARRRFGLGEAR